MMTLFSSDARLINDNGRISFSGLSSGIDFREAVDSIIEARRFPVDRLETRVEENTATISALREMESLVAQVQEATEALRGARSVGNTADIFEAKLASATSSREDGATPTPAGQLVSANVTNAAQTGTFEVEVVQRAQAQRISSDSQLERNEALGLSGDIEVNGRVITIQDSDTLLDIRDRLNNANSGDDATGVSASVISVDDNDHRLVLSSDETGVENEMTLADPDGVLEALGVVEADGVTPKNELRAAQDADLVVDGIAVTRSSNNIDDLFDGVTLDLLQAEEDTTVEIEIQQDLNQVREETVNFVDAFNALKQFINAQRDEVALEGQDEDTVGVLRTNSALRDVETRLNSVLGLGAQGVGENGFTVLSEIGIDFRSRDSVSNETLRSTLEIDDQTLNEALLNDPDKVRDLFSFRSTTDSTDITVTGFDGNTRHKPDGDFELEVEADADGNLVSATIDGVEAEVDGTRIIGPAGTNAEGIRLRFSGGDTSGDPDGTRIIHFNVSNGIASEFFFESDALLENRGPIDGEIGRLEDQNAQAETRITRQLERLEFQRERLIERFVELERRLAELDNVSSQLESLTASLGND